MDNSEPVIEIKPLAQSQKPAPRLPTIHIETYAPLSNSNAQVSHEHNIRNTEYTIGAPDSQATGIRPYYNVENFNKTDVRNNYNLDRVYQPPVTTPSPKVDGFNVPPNPNPTPAATYAEVLRPTVAPQTQLSPSLSARVSYAETDSDDRDVISGRMDTNPNYYAYEAEDQSSGTAGSRSGGNRNANSYELPAIVRPLTDNRNGFINSRSNANNERNNNNDYVTAGPRLLNPTQFFHQIYGKGLLKISYFLSIGEISVETSLALGLNERKPLAIDGRSTGELPDQRSVNRPFTPYRYLNHSSLFSHIATCNHFHHHHHHYNHNHYNNNAAATCPREPVSFNDGPPALPVPAPAVHCPIQEPEFRKRRRYLCLCQTSGEQRQTS